MTAFRSDWPLWCALVVGACGAIVPQAPGASQTVKLLSSNIRHESSIEVIAFSPDGKSLAVAGGYGTPRKPTDPPAAELSIWDVTTGKKRASLEGHTDIIRTVAFSPDGKTLASGSRDKAVRLWDVATGKEVAALKESPNEVYSVAFGPDSKTVAGSVGPTFDKENKADWTKPGAVLLWDAATRKVRATLNVDIGVVLQLAFSPDGKTLATATRKWDVKQNDFMSSEVWFWDAATGKRTGRLKAHSGTGLTFAYSPDGKTLATAGDQSDDPEPSPGRSRVKLWDTATLKLKASEPFFQSSVSGLAFSSDGKVLVVGSWSISDGWPYIGALSTVSHSEARLVDAENLKPITKIPNQDWATGVAFRPNEKVFATLDDKRVKLWELPGKR